MKLDPDDPRLSIPGPPGGERYLCPLRRGDDPCLWFFDVPPPEFDPPSLVAEGPSYRLTVTHVPMAAIEVVLAEHLATHDEDDLSAEMVTALRRFRER